MIKKKIQNKRNYILGNYMWDGSYTVEAAFILPMILGILYAWMFQLFYLRDQVVMRGMLDEMVVECQMGRESGEEDSQEAYKQMIQSCLWIAKITSLQQKNNVLQTKCNLKASATWGISLIEPYLGTYFQSDLSSSVGSVHPEKTLRLTRKDETS
jgi:hypothetical protein